MMRGISNGALLVAMMALLGSPHFAEAAVVPARCWQKIQETRGNWRVAAGRSDIWLWAHAHHQTVDMVRGDVDGNGLTDSAVLLSRRSGKTMDMQIAVCFAAGDGATLQVIESPYGGDGITLTPKGGHVTDFEHDRDLTLQSDGITSYSFDHAVSGTYVFEQGTFRLIITGD